MIINDFCFTSLEIETLNRVINVNLVTRLCLLCGPGHYPNASSQSNRHGDKATSITCHKRDIAVPSLFLFLLYIFLYSRVVLKTRKRFKLTCVCVDFIFFFYLFSFRDTPVAVHLPQPQHESVYRAAGEAHEYSY